MAFPVAKGPLVSDLICTLGSDGLLMHAAMLFQSSIPPIFCASGGSKFFLLPFNQTKWWKLLKSLLEWHTIIQNAEKNGGSLWKISFHPTCLRICGICMIRMTIVTVILMVV